MCRGHLVFLGLCTLLFLSFAKSENEFSDGNNQESLGFLEAVSDLSASLDASTNHPDEEPLENELVVEPLVAATRAQLLHDNVIPSPSAQTMDGDITEYESTKNALDKGSDEVCRPSTSDTMSCVGDQDMHNKSKLNEASATSRGPSSSENSTSSNSQPNVSDSLKRSSSSLGTKVFMIIAIILLSIFLASVVLYLMFRRSPVPSKNEDSNEVNEMVHTPVSGFQKA